MDIVNGDAVAMATCAATTAIVAVGVVWDGVAEPQYFAALSGVDCDFQDGGSK